METSSALERPIAATALLPPYNGSTANIDNRRALAQAIVDTVREPFLVLDKDLRVVTASRSFYLKFRMSRQDVQGRAVYALDEGQWNIPALRFLLENIAPQHTVMEDYEVERDFTGIGRRTILLSARKVFYEENSHTTILLSFEDITERRAKEHELDELLRQKELLLQEIQHRVANSLQIIASILLIKARTVGSEETRMHLQDAHHRVMSIATLQQQFQIVEPGETIALGPYLARLCEVLAGSMIADNRPISLKVHAQGGTASSSQAVSIGLIVTELVINAFKHAFPTDRSGGTVRVTYDVAELNWKLTVSDNGIGRPEGRLDKSNPGLGTTIIEALAKQLDASVEVLMDTHGTTVSITHAPIASQLPAAA